MARNVASDKELPYLCISCGIGTSATELLRPRGATAIAWEDRDSGFDRLAGMNLTAEEGVPLPSPDSRRLAFEDLIYPLPRGNSGF